MKVIIAGGRDYAQDNEEQKLEGFKILDDLATKFEITKVVCGKAKGADTLGEVWALSRGIDVAEFPADWNRYGKRAGPVRNEQMGDYADMAICFWDGKSYGTKHMIDYMKSLGKNTIIKYYNQEEFGDEW